MRRFLGLGVDVSGVSRVSEVRVAGLDGSGFSIGNVCGLGSPQRAVWGKSQKFC